MMKKTFTLAAFLLATMSMTANAYTCPSTICVNGETVSSKDANVDVTKQDDGTYTLTLKNLIVPGENDEEDAIGTLTITGAEATVIGNTTVIKANKDVSFTAGDDASKDWIGPELGSVPVLLHGELKGETFRGIINLNLFIKNVNLILGEKGKELGQLPNSGFEEFHTAKYNSATSKEPNSWHSFMTATGKLANQVAEAVHTFIDTEVRSTKEDPSSTSSQCVKIISTPVKKMGIIFASANGTITTGRLQAGSMTATDKTNCSFLDFTSTDKDGNNDPYYTVLNNKPDAIKVWVKYQAGEGNTTNAKATISAILSNGKKIQDPKDDSYNANIIAEANNSNITNTTWQPITIPFTYSKTDNMPQGALVTMSTCATASGGSKSEKKPDILWVDDIELIYNHNITSIKYGEQTLINGSQLTLTAAPNLDDFEVTSDGVGAYISKKIVYNEHDHTSGTIYFTATSNDLKNATTQSVTFTINSKEQLSETFTTQDYGYATYCPYIPVKFPTEDGIRAYNVTYDNSTVTTTEINGTAPAGTPLLLRAKNKGAQEYTLHGSNETAQNIESSMAISDGTEVGDGNLYVLSNGSKGVGFYKLKSGTIIPKDKCYIKVMTLSDANSTSFFSLGDASGSTTAIDHIENTAATSTEPIYNLAGQKVNASYKGIVIKGGKKQIIK